MKTISRMMGCMAIMLLLATNTGLSASGRTSDDSPRIEKNKKSGWIGVMVQDVSEKIAHKAKLDSEEGAYVSEVVDESPADSAGIKEGDIIIEFDGKHLFDSDDLAKAVRKTSPGTKVSLLIGRNGEKQTLSLTIGRNKELKHKMFGVVPHIPDIRVCVRTMSLGCSFLHSMNSLANTLVRRIMKACLWRKWREKVLPRKRDLKQAILLSALEREQWIKWKKYKRNLRNMIKVIKWNLRFCERVQRKYSLWKWKKNSRSEKFLLPETAHSDVPNGSIR